MENDMRLHLDWTKSSRMADQDQCYQFLAKTSSTHGQLDFFKQIIFNLWGQVDQAN